MRSVHKLVQNGSETDAHQATNTKGMGNIEVEGAALAPHVSTTERWSG
jgi:hypothetical protein